MREDNTPFFILGSPRSGTTLLREILKSHERLTSPEETFYFRWPFPLGTVEYRNTYTNNPTIKHHREIDGLDEEQFLAELDSCSSRKQLMDFHGEFIAKKTGKPRWFDKTPQNVYGAFLLASYYPTSKFICIWRDPLNVTASLIKGSQIKADTIDGAINYWMESALIMLEFARLYGDRLITLLYENLTANPQEIAGQVLSALNEDPKRINYPWHKVHQENNHFESALTREQIVQVQETTAKVRARVGY